MQIVQSLKDKNLWEPLDLAKLDADAIGRLQKPTVLNDASQEVRIVRAERDRQKHEWFMVLQGGVLKKQNLLIQGEDLHSYQYVLITTPPEKIANNWRVIIQNVYRSKYHREHPRFNTAGSGWFISNIELPVPQLELEKRHVLVSSIFESYRQRLQKEFRNTHISLYTDQTDPLLSSIHKTGRGFFLSNTEEPDSYTRRTKLRLSGKDLELLSYQDLNPANVDELARQYQKSGIKSDLILPLLYPNPDKEINIGYIRIGVNGERVSAQQIMEKAFATSRQIISSIQLSNFKTFALNEQVNNASRTGLGLEFSSPEIIDLIRQNGAFRCHLHLDPETDPLKIRIQKVFHTEQGSALRVGGKLLNVQQPGTVEENSGLIIYHKALQTLLRR